jgi:hypothetical protein
VLDIIYQITYRTGSFPSRCSLRYRYVSKICLLSLLTVLASSASLHAQFVDNFDGPTVALDPEGNQGWLFLAGDGTATMDLRQGSAGYASVLVDGTTDKRGIWWALIERKLHGKLDLSLLKKPGYEVRIEARVRSSHAPRRINLQVATQRTTDDYSQLMEYDIPTTNDWYTFSLTTNRFDAVPGDTVIAHLALMDWGLEKYRLDIDYVKVDVVNVATAGPDKGDAVPYHPPVADYRKFHQIVPVEQDSMIDLENTDVNLNDWQVQDGNGKEMNVLTVDGTHYVILRWDLKAFAGGKVADHGLLEVTTWAIQQKAHALKDFGLVRVVEILGGDRNWDQRSVTTDSFCHYERLDQVLNTQMIIDWPIAEGVGGKTYLTIGKPVLQRMIDGKTLGIAIKPLGAISASFYSMESEAGKNAARLYFDLQK